MILEEVGTRKKDMNNNKVKVIDNKTLIDEMNNIDFYKCDGVRVGDVLYYAHTLRNRTTKFNSIKIAIGRILRFAFFSNVEFEIHGKPDTLFLMSNLFRKRQDLQRSFRAVVELSENNIYMFFSDKFRISVIGIISIPVIIRWNKQIRGILKENNDRMYYLGYIYEAYLEYYYFERFCRKRHLTVDKLVSICDVQLTDSYFTQKFNMLKKKTITLQHGIMCSTHNTWTFSGSHSDYFIANSRFTESESAIVGYGHNMIVAGLISCVNNQPLEKLFSNKRETIGVMVDGEDFRIDNYRTISTMAAYCTKYNKKLLVKLHPLCDIDIYRKEFRDENVIKFVKKEMTLNQFFDIVDVAVVRNSTTLIEALQYGIPTYIINDEYQVADIYKNVNMLKFSNENEFHDLIDDRSEEEIFREYKSAREFFGCIDDVTQQYKNVFMKLGVS